jgi:hypothetical protein
MTKMLNSREATLKALENFSRWMDIRKRYKTSVGGRYLSALMQEQEGIKAAFEDFKKEFFLEHYLGHEDEILCQVYVAQVGRLENIAAKDKSLSITRDPKAFLEDTVHLVLYQDDYIVMAPDNVGADLKTFSYISEGRTYRADLVKKDLWNIFDEFALFSGLERYEGESNHALAQRILAAFRRPTSAADTGIKNAIINAVMGESTVVPEDIQIESPDSENMQLTASGGRSVYDVMSEMNKDIAREKIWNHCQWENRFKKMQYIPNVWDSALPGYQNGVGQRSDLKAALSSEFSDADSTDVEVFGYADSSILVNNYMRKQNVKKTIPLQIKKYKNELVPKDVRFKVTAAPAVKIDPTKILLDLIAHSSGEVKHDISDLLIDKGAAAEIQRGTIAKNKVYTLKFKARSKYGNMSIEKCCLVNEKGETTSLLTQQPGFSFNDGVVKNADVKLHAKDISSFLSAKNIENHPDGGITLGADGTRGEFFIGTTGMNNMPIITKVSCEKTNYTNNTAFVKLFGDFSYSSDGSDIVCRSSSVGNQIIVEMNCTSISYDLSAAASAEDQGTISVLTEIDGVISAEHSGLKTEGKTYEIDLDNLHLVKLTITKVGVNPVIIRNIKASRYRMTYSLSSGEIIRLPGYMKLPADIPQGALLKVSVESFSTFYPVIEYIHIGPSIENAVYSLKKINSGNNVSFNIKTDCIVSLYEERDGQDVLVSDNYITSTTYQNNTNETVGIYLNLDAYLSIRSASKTIKTGAYSGKVTKYIDLSPGEQVDTIAISGERKTIKARKSLSKLLGNRLTADDEVYISGNSDGFILLKRDRSTRLVSIHRKEIGFEADEYAVSGLPENTTGFFVTDEVNKTCRVADRFSQDFVYFYIGAATGKKYIAYNEVKMLQSPTTGISLVNTFSPPLDMNRLMFYKIENAALDGKQAASVSFVSGTEHRAWALGSNYDDILASYALDFTNESAYQLTVQNLNESFTLSNTIELKSHYTSDGKDYELARYIITPPENMRITYTTESAKENIIIEEDGFNKLYYSNVSGILSITADGRKLADEDFSLLEEAGIVAWKRKDLTGKTAAIVYEYRCPKTIEFKDLSYLYEMIGYSIDAYEPLNEKPLRIAGVHNGETRSVQIGGKTPGKIVARCLNSNFQAFVSGNNILIQRRPAAASVLIRPGYYYDQEKEYYFFEHDRKELVQCYENIRLNGTQNIGNTIRTIQHSSNYVKDSIMTNGSHFETVCHIDFVENRHRLDGISTLNTITACDSYQQWNDFGMTVEITRGINGNGLLFRGQEPGAYAYLELTPYIHHDESCALSFYADPGIKASIGKEIFAGGDSMRKSTHMKIIGVCERENDFLSFSFSNLDDEARYYLLVEGSGMIDDLVVCDHRMLEDEVGGAAALHKKNLKKLGFDIQEKALSHFEKHLMFDPSGNIFHGLELDMKGRMAIGSSADYGVTLIKDLRDDFSDFSLNKTDLQKGAFYAGKDGGEITSSWIEIPSHQAISAVYVKINDVLIDPFRDFSAHVYTAENSAGQNKREVFEGSATNLIEIQSSSLMRCLQFVIEMPPKSVINSIEVYVRYVENQAGLRVFCPQSGALVTKVYDTSVVGNFRPKYIAGSAGHSEHISIYIRGYRQDDAHGVFTEWYPCQFNEHLIFSDSCHIFEGYRYFQFMIQMDHQDSYIHIEEFVLEVV